MIVRLKPQKSSTQWNVLLFLWYERNISRAIATGLFCLFLSQISQPTCQKSEKQKVLYQTVSSLLVQHAEEMWHLRLL